VKLAQRGIQIVMTTHKFDTTASVPEQSNVKMFRMKKTGEDKVVGSGKPIVTIKSILKLQSVLDFTQNARFMTRLSVKIYVESHDDEILYSLYDLNSSVVSAPHLFLGFISCYKIIRFFCENSDSITRIVISWIFIPVG
jgi:hypothetical protein